MSGDARVIYHLMSAEDWAASQSSGFVAPESLTTEGFVHNSRADQVAGVRERYYAGRDDMLLLTIDESAIGLDVVWEAPAHPDGTPNTEAEEHQRYPHVYGPIPVSAVVGVQPLR